MALLNETKLRTFGSEYLQNRGRTIYAANEELIKEAKEFSAYKTYDVFLSHRTKDASVALGMKRSIETQGLSVYVYWIEDPQSTGQPVTRSVADSLRTKMRACKSLIYADTPDSSQSKWMPWELGYVDGYRKKVVIYPVARGQTQQQDYQGQEYLGIYPWITENSLTNSILMVKDQSQVLNSLKDWINS